MRECALLPILALIACAKPTVYEQWGKRLDDLSQSSARVEDVSLLLGEPPSHCEAISEPDPIIGVLLAEEQPEIKAVTPGSPAEKAGLRRGETIKSISGEETPTPRSVGRAIRSSARRSSELEIQTDRSVYVVVPHVPDARQCYWGIDAGETGRSGGVAFVNPHGGSASANSATYRRFFRASCRVHDGRVVTCRWNWQQ